MRIKLFTTLALLLMAVSGAWADASGNCGTTDHESEVTWTFTTSDGKLTISGTGAMADYNRNQDTGWHENNDAIKSIVIGSGVTSIGNYSFQNCFHLTSVSIPASVTSIGNYAFASCGTNAAALTVNFAEGTAPMTIGYCAFGGANLTSITIPNRVTSIDDSAFNGCTNLASVSIPASVTSIGETAFLHSGIYATALTVTFAEGTSPMTIGPGAFAESNLTSITIPNRVTSIGEYAFLGCGNLATITLNSNPTIGTGAFGSAAVTMNLTANGPVDGAYWTTFYNENYGFTADTNTKIYKAKVNDGKTAVVLTEVADIPAGNAAVLKSSNAAITMTLTTSTCGDYTDNELLGTDVALDNPGNAYCLSNETTGSARGVGFYSYTSTDGPNGDGVIPAHRAYLQIPSSARSFYGFGDDNYTTDIDLPEAVVIEDDGPIYDLSGRQVTGQPQKGIYVKNGKKVVIK